MDKAPKSPPKSPPSAGHSHTGLLGVGLDSSTGGLCRALLYDQANDVPKHSAPTPDPDIPPQSGDIPGTEAGAQGGVTKIRAEALAVTKLDTNPHSTQPERLLREKSQAALSLGGVQRISVRV